MKPAARHRVILLILVCLVSSAPGWAQGPRAEESPARLTVPETSSGGRIPSTPHSGKAGVYVRLGAASRGDGRGTTALERHPLLDAVVLGGNWRTVEPRRGVYDFGSLEAEVMRWGRAGKGVVLGLGYYGQRVDDAETPPWVYQQPGVRAIPFRGGGQARGREIRIPAVWDEGFVEGYLAPLVAAFAKAFDGHPHVWYVMPGFGHIGNLTAQPSRDGSLALTDAGFTGDKWVAYCRRVMALYQRHFTRTPLLVKAAGGFIRSRQHGDFEQEAGRLLVEFGRGGAAVVHFDLRGDPGSMAETYRRVGSLVTDARRGITRIGLGDDWPLWVPPGRRQHGPTRNHDEGYLRNALENAFGGQAGVPEIPTTILFLQEPELLASDPTGTDHHAEVHDALAQARERLRKNDAALFGSP